MRQADAALLGLHNPLQFAHMVGGHPQIHFHWKEVGGKHRLIGNPNASMRALHELFGQWLRNGIYAMGKVDNYPLRRLPSSAAFVKGSNPLKNAQRHSSGKFFYITDIWNAYPSVDLEKLAVLIVYIQKHHEYKTNISLFTLGVNVSLQQELRRDQSFHSIRSFLESFCSGVRGEGLAVGGPLSPYLFNLYCEVFIDAQIRKICDGHFITYTRYADDCVFSRSKPVIGDLRKDLRGCITRAGFNVNHRKSKVLSREMGTVFVTKVGLRENPSDAKAESITVFSRKKRRHLHGIIGGYLAMQMDWPEKVSGFVAEFIHYYKNVKIPTASDRKTFELCKIFEREWAKHR